MSLDYPKHVYLNGDVDKESTIVKNAAEEMSAALRGYKEIPRHFGPGVSGVADEASAPPLDYPRFLYLGGDLEAESRLVRNADEEAEAAGNGYLRFGTGAPKAVDLSGYSAKEAIEKVGLHDNLDVLETLLADEDRATVRKAIEKRIGDLKG